MSHPSRSHRPVARASGNMLQIATPAETAVASPLAQAYAGHQFANFVPQLGAAVSGLTASQRAAT